MKNKPKILISEISNVSHMMMVVKVRQALYKAGYSQIQISEFIKKACHNDMRVTLIAINEVVELIPENI